MAAAKEAAKTKGLSPPAAAGWADPIVDVEYRPPERPPTYRQGDRIVVKAKDDHAPMHGLIQFVGEIRGKASGVWIGVQLDDPVGTSNGSVNGRRLFQCPNKYGDFFRPSDIEPEQEDDATNEISPPTSPSETPSVQRGAESKWNLVRADVRTSDYNAMPLTSDRAAVENCIVAGRGLETCVVNQLAQFGITAYDSTGKHRETGGDPFTAVVRPISGQRQLRVKVHDHGNGTYTCEYKAEVTGQIVVDVKLNGQALNGSPFTINAVTLRPETSKCVLRGDALTCAIARQPMSFEIEFVDALGQISHAEELDVRLERVDLPEEVKDATADEGPHELTQEEIDERLATPGVLRIFLKKGSGLLAADMDGKSDPYVILRSGDQEMKSSCKPKTINPNWNQEMSMDGCLQDFVQTGLALFVFDMDNPDRPERDTPLGDIKLPLSFLVNENSADFLEPLQNVSKGKLQFSVQWIQQEVEEEAVGRKITIGDERVVIGSKALIVRSDFEIDSNELSQILPGTRVQLHEVREFEDGFRARVLVLSVPNQAKAGDVGLRGWITAAHNDGRRRLMRKHLKLSQDERRRQTELWNRRMSSDKLMKEKADKDDTKSGLTKAAMDLLMTNYSFEINDDPRGMAFAYGGLHPGTLHAHGRLIKTHTVHYSVGAAGNYLLHVGLRQKEEILPGSPFQLCVKPGSAHASCTRVPEHLLPLSSVVGKGGSMILPMLDNMGNLCIEGGAALTVTVRNDEKQARGKTSTTEDVEVKCEDLLDGNFRIEWSGKISGTFFIDLKLNKSHVQGSPVRLQMLAAEIDILRCQLMASHEAVAGQAQRLEMICHDSFGNDAQPQEGMTFGVIIIALPEHEKSSKAKKEKEKAERAGGATGDGDGGERKNVRLSKEGRENLIKTMPSMAFEGSWDKATYTLDYVPREAGDFELHVWLDPTGDGTRLFFPGCPSFLHVSPGRCSATQSFLRENTIPSSLTAGDRFVLKMQFKDDFSNNTPLSSPSEEVFATLETPDKGNIDLNLKQDVIKASDDGRDSKKKNHVAAVATIPGAYEISSPGELTVKGTHVAHILLHGSPVMGSPAEIEVRAAAPVAAKSRLLAAGRHLVDAPIELVLQLCDRFGNEVEEGGVRVDAKIFGSKASEARIIDRGDGTYTITFTAGVAGDYKATVKVENIEMTTLTLHVAQGEQLPNPVGSSAEQSQEDEALTSSKLPVPTQEDVELEEGMQKGDAQEAQLSALMPKSKSTKKKKKKATSSGQPTAAKSSRSGKAPGAAPAAALAAAPASTASLKKESSFPNGLPAKQKGAKSARKVSIQEVAMERQHSSEVA